MEVSTDPERSLELSLSRCALDRAGLARRDPELVHRALDDDRTRVLDLYGDRAPCSGERGARSLVYRAPREDDAGHSLLMLGREGGTTYLCRLHPPEHDGDHQRSDLRSLGMELDDRDVDVLTSAVGLANWHAHQGFCPRCGAPTVVGDGGWLRVCTADGHQHHPRTDPAVIMSVVDADDRLLLARGPRWPSGRLSVLAGFVEPGEALEAAVAREVHEEVGVDVGHVAYRGNQPWPFPASLMVGFRAEALTTELHLDPDEILEAHWYSRERLLGELESGTLGIPPHLSIARHLIEDWYGGPLPT